MLTILVFIVILGFLIFVHELGHFLVARRNGIKAEEFGFGFPPRVVGIQFLQGEEKKKVSQVQSIGIEKTEIKIGGEEIISETVTERIREVEKNVPVRKWRIIWGNKDGDNENEKRDLKEAYEKDFSGGTVYSLNWLPIGGFVKIKGENGDEKDEGDSFASKPAWTRVKVLAAGVIMNFFFAWILFSIGFMLGTPQEVTDPKAPGAYILIDKIEDNSPASAMGIRVGDVIDKVQIGRDGKKVELKTTEDVQNFINSYAGTDLTVAISRASEHLKLSGTPKISSEDGRGRLGIGLVQVAKISYDPFAALWKGLVELGAVLLMMMEVIKMLIAGNRSGMEVTGVVGIAVYTGQIIPLGMAYLMRFAAILSVNLGVINALPIPALDGGRILFIVIEKIKGSPVSQKLEQIFHTIGFALLMALMVFVTYRDFLKFDIVEKIKGIF